MNEYISNSLAYSFVGAIVGYTIGLTQSTVIKHRRKK